MRCDQCRHWDDTPIENIYWEEHRAGFGRCHGVRERAEIEAEVGPALPIGTLTASPEAIERRAKALEAVKAARAHLEASYAPALYTGPDFFCALFEPEED